MNKCTKINPQRIQRNIYQTWLMENANLWIILSFIVYIIFEGMTIRALMAYRPAKPTLELFLLRIRLWTEGLVRLTKPFIIPILPLRLIPSLKSFSKLYLWFGFEIIHTPRGQIVHPIVLLCPKKKKKKSELIFYSSFWVL